MRISSICYINSKGAIQLHKNAVEGLSIFDNSILFGVFYPRSKNENKSVFKEDFMISPIPYHLWFKTARLIIKLEVQSIGIKKISNFLNEQNISILHSTSNRSGHRYSVWDLHISYDELEYDENDFDKSKSYFKAVYEKTKIIKELIINKFKNEKNVLFRDQDNYHLTEYITTRVNTALHYFYYQTEINKADKDIAENKVMFSEFTLRYNSGVITTNSGKKISNIINLSKPNEKKRLFPTIAFIEGESHFLNFRLRIMSRERIDNFFKLTVFHERNDDNCKTTKGLLEYIVNSFDSNLKIWKFYNQIIECRDTFGSGKLNFIIETKNQNTNVIRKDLESLITNLDRNKPNHLSHINFWANTTPIYPNYIKHHFRKQRESLKNKENDVFISYSTLDYSYASKIAKRLETYGLNVYIAKKELRTGVQFNEKIRIALLNSREICLLYSGNSKKSEYVNTEWGAAWFMGKTIVPILLNCGEKEIEELDNRIKGLQYFSYNNDEKFDDYIDDIMSRKIDHLLNDDKNKYQ